MLAKHFHRGLLGLAAFASLSLGTATEASAQELYLTGPLAGAPAVRKLRLYRQGRLELTPGVAFSILDEYQSNIYAGARLQYHFTDWLGIGVWGAGAVLQSNTDLANEIQGVNSGRQGSEASRLTARQIGADFTKQTGSIDWTIAPQVTLIPFRGKISMFESIYVDADLYLFAGVGFMGVTERAFCDSSVNSGTPTDCGDPANPQATDFPMTGSMQVAGNFGIGLNFFVNDWNALGLELRAMPFSRNTSGFDTSGGGTDGSYPDFKVNTDDRDLKMNMMVNINWSFYLPTSPKITE